MFVFDRGFHDAVEIITDFGFQCEMPTFLNKTMKQHTTEEANSSRLVTTLRWVVESANSRLKRRKIFVVTTTQLPFIGDFVKIAEALTIAYRPSPNKS